MRLYPKMNDSTKQVRVDNWGIFFLQRLQTFYSKTDFCDMTLQFEGNVQLKVHRLVMNACTEYFQFLEQTCALEDNVIMMPSDLQADVIVPIVNFMYTGMLEFHLQFFDKLYKAAQLMNITILTKLLDAQKQPGTSKLGKKKIESPISHNLTKKTIVKNIHSDLPSPLPGRKLPVWKRKSLTPSQSQLSDKWNQAPDPLSVPDNTPKPTRFEWPDDDLPPISLMDTSFEDISYTSKPLLTQEEEHRPGTSFDDLKHIPNARSVTTTSKRSSSANLDIEEIKDYVKEQKIRSGLSHDDESVDNDLETSSSTQEITHKRKMEHKPRILSKRVKFDEPENKTATISIATDSKNATDLNHEKIVSELLKKYPDLVKKNKNIKLKIMAKNKTTTIETNKPKVKPQVTEMVKSEPQLSNKNLEAETETGKPWVCERCSTEDDPVEFVLYYLYRKHMTDVHSEKFDPKLCKYCGQRCNKVNMLMYHLYIKHGLKPSCGYYFPKCDQCPYIALSVNTLSKHKQRHSTNEMQCVECKLAFVSIPSLTSHMQITGHSGKSGKSNFDCQYCTKKFNSSINLFCHLRVQHRNEAIRDGIVSIDETDEFEDDDEEDDDQGQDNSKDEYILPEIIAEPEPSNKKVNILSNVKVQDRHEVQSRQLALEPSSEAEALNNVATGIATSLGLVEYVVLNDNQQLLFQSNQQNFSNTQNEQPEFILPELTGRESFTQDQTDVMSSDNVITQSMLSSSDIASTDELVMVLTDHDYGDNQEEINSDNSNIVVLYSHPVDGQQDQYITSQGNIMVNSQTGMIEIRNGATITSTANQVVMNQQESHIESIEMIQREIESHGELKQEELYVEENKPEIEPVADVTEAPDDTAKEEKTIEKVPEEESLKSDEAAGTHAIMESLEQGEQLEFTTTATETSMEQDQPEIVDEVNNQNIENNTAPNEEHNINPTPMDLEEEVSQAVEDSEVVNENITQDQVKADESTGNWENDTENIHKEQENAIPEHESLETSETAQNEGQSSDICKPDDVVSPDENITETESKTEVTTNSEDHCENQVLELEKPMEEPMESVQEESKETEVHNDANEDGDKAKVDEVEENEEASENVEALETERDNECAVEPQEASDISKENDSCATEEANDSVDNDKIEENKQENKLVEELSQSDTSTSQYNDENSQSSHSSHKKTTPEPTLATKISILDDWEDTDSQTSDQHKEDKDTGETVTKLMDDWEEEDEEESKK